MNNNKKKISEFDWYLFIPVCLLMIVGVLSVYSSSNDIYGNLISNEWIKQIIWSVISIGVLVTMSFLSLIYLKEIGYFIYFASVFGLLITMIFGQEINGAKAWLQIGSVSFQFAEFGKIGTIMVLTHHFNKYPQISVASIFFSLGLLALPLTFILLQPDLGTALVYVFIYFVLIILTNVNARLLSFVFLLFVSSLFFFLFPLWFDNHNPTGFTFFNILNDWQYMQVFFFSLLGIIFLSSITYYYYKNRFLVHIALNALVIFISLGIAFVGKTSLKSYHLNRLLVMLDPQLDPRGVGWNVIQSMTAIGSGGLFGKGFLQGVQSHLNYIPEQSTDFIISLILEETGFVGALVVIALYVWVICRLLVLSSRVKEPYERFLYGGIAAYIFIHVFINIGMNLGVLPVIGIPLLFISYGGSSMLSASMAIGVALMRYRFERKELV